MKHSIKALLITLVIYSGFVYGASKVMLDRETVYAVITK